MGSSPYPMAGRRRGITTAKSSTLTTTPSRPAGSTPGTGGCEAGGHGLGEPPCAFLLLLLPIGTLRASPSVTWCCQAVMDRGGGRGRGTAQPFPEASGIAGVWGNSAWMPRWRGPGDKRWSRALKAAGLPDRYKTWRLPPQPETLPGRHPSFPRRPLRGGGCGAAPRALPPPVSRSRPRSRFCPARGGLRCSRGGARAARGLVCPLGLGKARCF